ncbi:hypothetical protein EWM64_g5328 [Hericium alpestre]|uniref:Aldehyde dehydrogenase domain-containing protein n=1 Tax=Hericium alpestre TaxID=135208 RepID=A0A4Y9ZWW8_9AGAM|nr:hypothetical protein EWM64_g5328 [Hericium alpestre]
MSEQLKYTPLADISKIHAKALATFASGVTRPLEYRKQQLRQLGKMLQENEERLVQAIYVDVGKPRLEATVADIGPVVYGVVDALAKLDEWVKPEKVDDVPEWRASWDTTVYKAPKGVALLITYAVPRDALMLTSGACLRPLYTRTKIGLLSPENLGLRPRGEQPTRP